MEEVFDILIEAVPLEIIKLASKKNESPNEDMPPAVDSKVGTKENDDFDMIQSIVKEEPNADENLRKRSLVASLKEMKGVKKPKEKSVLVLVSLDPHDQ